MEGGDGEGGEGCEKDLSNERKGLLHRGHTYICTDRHTDGHCNSMTESAQWADSVKNNFFEFQLILGMWNMF